MVIEQIKYCYDKERACAPDLLINFKHGVYGAINFSTGKDITDSIKDNVRKLWEWNRWCRTDGGTGHHSVNVKCSYSDLI